MRILTLALPLAAALLAGPALAQPGHDEHHPAPAVADQAAMHDRCKTMMGSKMDAKHPHEHSADKQGVTTHAKGVKPTAAEMEKMHKQCAAMMAKAEAPAKK
jgi:hypothetical protein